MQPAGKRIAHPRRRSAVGQAEMYHIFTAQRQPQCGAPDRQRQAPEVGALALGADPPRLGELARPVGTGVGGMVERMELARARRRLDPLGAGEQGARACLQAEAIERVALQSICDLLRQVRGNGSGRPLECPRERTLELALGDGLSERGARHAAPRAASGSLGAHVGQDLPVGRKRQPHEVVPRVAPSRQDAGADGSVRSLAIAASR